MKKNTPSRDFYGPGRCGGGHPGCHADRQYPGAPLLRQPLPSPKRQLTPLWPNSAAAETPACSDSSPPLPRQRYQHRQNNLQQHRPKLRLKLRWWPRRKPGGHLLPHRTRPSLKHPLTPVDPDIPSFDTVNVLPTGEAVVAGHAKPGSDVALKFAGVGSRTRHGRQRMAALPLSRTSPFRCRCGRLDAGNHVDGKLLSRKTRSPLSSIKTKARPCGQGRARSPHEAGADARPSAGEAPRRKCNCPPSTMTPRAISSFRAASRPAERCVLRRQPGGRRRGRRCKRQLAVQGFRADRTRHPYLARR